MVNKTYSSIIIGAGFSGLAMGIKLKEKGISNFLLLEKATEVGGTWRENTYPGAECDVPSALYSYSFEPYADWEYKWSLQPQILSYIKQVAKKYDLYQHIHFNKEMAAAVWQEAEGVWAITTKDGSQYKSKIVVSAVGQLHHPSTPNFKGKDTFKGDSFHSAKWNHSIDLAGKTVGVIGNAASAVQFIPEIVKTVGKLVIFQRSANWMLPKQDRAYKEWEKKLVRRFPLLLKIYRLQLWLLGGGLFFLMKNGNNWLRKIYQNQTITYIKEHIKDPELVKQLTPNYPMGAKRVLFSDTYYPALAKPNVQVVMGGVNEITPNSVVAGDGSSHPIDVLIYATGFKTNPFLVNMAIKGKGGLSIKEAWKDGPKNYLGMTVHNFPNFFMMYGPNTNLGHNSIILMSEAQADYIAQCVDQLEKKDWKSLEIKKEVLETYHQTTQSRLNNMIWTRVEDSWYKSSNGNIPNNYPGRTMEYIRKTKQVNFKDYDIGAI